MRIAWFTDLHLNFVERGVRDELYRNLLEAAPDAILVGGDWGEANSLTEILKEWASAFSVPTYFVLGNHDFYRGSIKGVRAKLSGLAGEQLCYLTTSGVIGLTADTALIGHDSWADGRCGDFFTSRVVLNDYLLIEELKGLGQERLFAKLNSLGDEAAEFLEVQLVKALKTHQKVILLTHVPPFREACWHEGQISNDDYLPHFACFAVGRKLEAVMSRHPDQSLLVLCGHTHGAGVAEILPNLIVHTGAAVYGQPAIQRILDV